MKQFTKLAIAIVPALVMLGCGSKGDVKEAGGDSGVQQGRVAGAQGSGAAAVGSGAAGSSATSAGSSGSTGAASSGGSAAGGSAGSAGSSGSPASATAGGATGSADQSGGTKPGMLPAEQKLYFDFDKSEIRSEYKTLLMAHVSYMLANPSVKVAIEGHCDERGTREYNLALGERRAHAVKQFLVLQGVAKDQVTTVTFGEERPDAAGHDESAWKFNRRAVFVYSK